MYNIEELQSFKPKLIVQYKIGSYLIKGNVDYVPENAFGAIISFTFPIVNAKGRISFGLHSYNLFVGTKIKIDDVLQNNHSKVENDEFFVKAKKLTKGIEEWRKKGFTDIVSTSFGFLPVDYQDEVFETNNEMASAIKKISESFNSIDIIIQNSSSELEKVPGKNR